MSKKILVAYASKYGSTQEIAEKIGDVLAKTGLLVDMMGVERVTNLKQYDAVILGSAIYVGNWPKEASHFLKNNEGILSNCPVWIFASGPTGEGNPVEMINGNAYPSALRPSIELIHPREVTAFHGFINIDKINAIEKWAIKNVVKKPFGDYRDWDSISDWASSIGDALNII